MRDANLDRRQFLELSLIARGASLVVGDAAAEGGPPVASSSSSKVVLTVNGRRVAHEIDPRTSLLDLLRERLGLTGTKNGCNQGACGACTVLVNDRRVNACLMLAAICDGAKVTTIEGL